MSDHPASLVALRDAVTNARTCDHNSEGDALARLLAMAEGVLADVGGEVGAMLEAEGVRRAVEWRTSDTFDAHVAASLVREACSL